jgi:hypothetical protein
VPPNASRERRARARGRRRMHGRHVNAIVALLDGVCDGLRLQARSTCIYDDDYPVANPHVSVVGTHVFFVNDTVLYYI